MMHPSDVGIFQRMSLDHSVGRITAAADDVAISPGALPIASPWADSTLNEIVFNDIIGKGVVVPISRAAAMRIPSVARARNLLVSTICRFPLVDFDDQTRTAEQPHWLQSTAGLTHPQLRMAWTVDDLIFYGWSIWSCARNPLTNEIIAADRINRERWHFDNGRVMVDDKPAQADEVIVFAGLHEGILSYGMDAISDTKLLYRMVRARLKTPKPNLVLRQTGGEQQTDEQIDAHIARWSAARQGENGGVGWLNESMEAVEMGEGDAELMIEARNAAALDIARVVGVAGSRIDATSPKSTLNYETTTGRNQEFVDFDLALYMTPISAALSMDNVSPSGRRIAFDMGDFIALAPSPTGAPTED